MNEVLELKVIAVNSPHTECSACNEARNNCMWSLDAGHVLFAASERRELLSVQQEAG